MELVLQRDADTPGYTYGVLTVGDLTLQTMERPWIPAPDHPGGQNGVSRVPAGAYQLVPHDSPKHPETWALHNPSLGVYAEPPVPASGGRADCLIHPANTADQLEGCIAPGVERGVVGSQPAVLLSRDAFAKIKVLVPWTSGHTLTIIDG